jgi:hypothetical protein
MQHIAAGRRAVIWGVDGASQSRMAAWMVVRSVYSCIVTIGVNIRICRISRASCSTMGPLPADGYGPGEEPRPSTHRGLQQTQSFRT